ncbi:hypothetical protein EMIHUDRAFT_354054 [Emiliania huxleyi CCMP1516]|uniref:DNA-directed DNA polymerase n=3 Tax=Emiliania huxleyi TaxID=2903 RepID=A0A0D3JQG7_EMIH1|nr:hypothetical protein EMIHUDRAFT_354054 [Emiliania huxleyi CCMP1516]EOD25752.1 hypothetical protein EMIHUDRAFT_354054 [Emiliania huxleyi CCMP1516]|eukprot:XP_005778181.1 hypothetical protein EMIHUDRAFT_354054 [Emiliania huxleyi CCMP1516]
MGNAYTRAASRLVEEAAAGGRIPGAAVLYANTDSVFVALPGRTAAAAVQEARSIAEFVSGQLPPALTLEYERVLRPLAVNSVSSLLQL